MHLANYYINTNDTINAVSAYNELERIATKQKKLNLIKRLGLRIGAFLNDSEICGSIAGNLVNSQSVYDKKDAYGEVTLSGNWIDFNCEELKAFLPMEVTPEGMVTVSIEADQKHSAGISVM